MYSLHSYAITDPITVISWFLFFLLNHNYWLKTLPRHNAQQQNVIKVRMSGRQQYEHTCKQNTYTQTLPWPAPLFTCRDGLTHLWSDLQAYDSTWRWHNVLYSDWRESRRDLNKTVHIIFIVVLWPLWIGSVYLLINQKVRLLIIYPSKIFFFFFFNLATGARKKSKSN